jgi:hypothetical protein
MRSHPWLWPVLAASTVLLGGCAHQEALGGGGVLAPVNAIYCEEQGDIYGSNPSPCTGFVYGDYEQYPNFAPSTREVVLAGDRHRQTHVVTRTGFTDASNSNSSFSNPYGDYGSGSSASSPAPPRMDPVVVNAPSAPPVVSRQR